MSFIDRVAFDIFLSVDLENQDLPPSATIRFYKVRENYHIVTVEKWTTISSQSEFFSCPKGQHLYEIIYKYGQIET